MGVDASDSVECKSLVWNYLSLLKTRLREALEDGRRPPSLREVVSLAREFIIEKGGCKEEISLPEEYQAVAKLALDFSMEALSRYMEVLPEDVYSIVSGVITAYAVHIAKLVAAVLDEASRLGGLAALVLEAAEPLIFAAASRMLALSLAVGELGPDKLAELVDRLKWVVDVFVAEDNSYLKALYMGLYGDKQWS